MKSFVKFLACLTATSALVQNPGAAGTLLQFDFNGSVTWPHLTELKPGVAGVTLGKFGTPDQADSADASGGLLLAMDAGEQPAWFYGKAGYVGPAATPAQEILATKQWNLGLSSGPLAVQNTETNLGKLTLSFSLAASLAQPIQVIVESFDARRKRTGALSTTVFPAASDFYQRYALDLSTFQSTGEGKFDPSAPFVAFTYLIGSANGWAAGTHHELRLDNVHYATPAFYVSPQGSDGDDGRTEQSAFANPQKAVEAAQPGDIIVVMNGTYSRAAGQPEKTPVVRFVRPGTPAGWITLKNYPGHTPVISSRGQTGIEIIRPPKGSPEEDQKLSYLEIRGLHVRGNGDTAREKYPAEIGSFTPNTDSQGIVINGRFTRYPGARTPGEIVHHIRLADNLVDFNTADGVYIEYCDWLFIENNRIENNCWATPGYAPSGIAVMGYANFDGQDNVYKMLISGNRVSGNKLTVPNHPWGEAKRTKFYNGNGILLDANAEKPLPLAYLGRTLVHNNVVFHNGAGGIQMWGSHRVDLVNNTVWMNATVLPWGQVAFERCQDVRLINNIIVAPKESSLDTWFAGRADERTAKILRLNNLYWGGAQPNIPGFGDLVADPQFVHPSSEAATADFHLKPGSPAVSAGRWELFTPPVDADGKLRPQRTAINLGAYQN